MLKFLVFDEQGLAAKSHPVRNAYLLSSDNNAMQGQITFEEGVVVCQKRETSSAALALQHPAGDCGELTLQTCLLPEREEPYLLNVELARYRLMSLYTKLEDWAMFDIGPEHPLIKIVDEARGLFIDALCEQTADPAAADRLARESLQRAIDGSERLAVAHSELLLNRRKATGLMPKHPVGCGVKPQEWAEQVRSGLLEHFDFHYLPVPWRALAPEEGEYHWEPVDRWAEWIARNRKPVIAGPIISFDPRNVPDWLFIWEHDYDTVRDLVYEHIERVVTRYRNVVTSWDIVSGLHINSHFTFNFEQLMDLTRMSVMLVKKIQPAARALVEIRQPFGEYYGSNQRSIPPLLYADLLIQSAIQFDGFVIKLLMGQAVDGQYTRDVMQISNLLDHFVGFGKPVNLLLAVPSSPVMPKPGSRRRNAMDPVDAMCGYWREPWSEPVQSKWIEVVGQIAMSKPFVESVAWYELIDHAESELPMSGLVLDNLSWKESFSGLVSFRNGLTSKAATASGNAELPQAPVAEA